MATKQYPFEPKITLEQALASAPPHLREKIEESVQIIKKAEPLAMEYNPEQGFNVAFSGGKDSMALLWLFEHLDVKYHAEMQCTTIDPPELMAFVREVYTSTGRVRLNLPLRYPDGKPVNFLTELEKTGAPSPDTRWCCDIFKEFSGKGEVVAVGLRTAESARRKKQNPTPLKAFGGKKTFFGTKLHPKEVGEHSVVKKAGKKFVKHVDLFDIDAQTILGCVRGAEKVMLSPIWSWTDADVWSLIKTFHLPYCKLYDCGYTRLGCLLCPMSDVKTRIRDAERYPIFVKEYTKRIATFFKHCSPERKEKFRDAEDFVEWFIYSGESVDKFHAKKDYPKLFDDGVQE